MIAGSLSSCIAGFLLSCAALHDPRSRPDLWRRRHAPLRAMGIRDKPTAPASPWQNGFAEWLIGSIRRECVDHIIVLGEAHLRRILKSYTRYYNLILATIMRRGHTWPWVKMRRFLARFSEPV
jgi:transposase InsO family protein